MLRLLTIPLVGFALIGCQHTSRVNDTPNMATTYTNPIIDHYLADPCLIWDEPEQAYFLIATGPTKQDGRALPIYRSTDLKNWEFLHGAIERGATPEAWNYKHFWAPEVTKIGDTYYLYYTASPEHSPKNSGNRVGLATSKHITGPYTDQGVVVPHGSIDGHVYIEGDELYIYYTSEHLNSEGFKPGQIYVDRMLDPKTVVGEPQQLVSHLGWQEGPWMQKRDGIYFLTYSAGGWAGDTYHMRYATGDSPLGPFTDQDEGLLTTNAFVKGPGHHSMFKDHNGDDWICYHGWDPDLTARYPRIDRASFKNGKLTTNGPTSTPQPLP